MIHRSTAILEVLEVANPAGARVVFDVPDPFVVERYRENCLELIHGHVEIGVVA